MQGRMDGWKEGRKDEFILYGHMGWAFGMGIWDGHRASRCAISLIFIVSPYSKRRFREVKALAQRYPELK